MAKSDKNAPAAGETVTVESTPVAQLASAASKPAAGKFVPKVKKLVTLPTLTIKGGETHFLQFLSKIELSKVKQKVKNPKTGEMEDQEPAHIAQVVALDSGEPRTLIVNAVLVSIMKEEYPNDSYLDKGFQITAADPKAGKRYKGFTVAELDLS